MKSAPRSSRKSKLAASPARRRGSRGGDLVHKSRWIALCRTLGANLLRGARSAALRPVAAKLWAASPEQLFAVVVAGVVVGIALQWTFYGASARFNWYALRDQWLDLPVFLLVGWLAARFAKPAIKPLMLPIALFAATIVVSVLLTAALHLTMHFWRHSVYVAWSAIYYGWQLWFLLIATVLLRRSARLAYRYIPLVVLPLVALGAYDIYYPRGPMWYVPQATRAAARSADVDSPVSEEMLYLQPRLLRRTLDAVASQRPGVADLYFVGFAPYAREDVFRKESEVIRTLMDDRFDTRGRSVLLVNNDRTLREYPLATVTNLGAALKRVGHRINRNEDVVMVYLTSHGSQDHELSSSYWPLQLEAVTPKLLKQLLDDAGIRWRVIVVSACYAGGFIEPLRDPGTLVITAADATHTSFGCGATSDFTYFAKALFDEQLRKTYSFERAFERALPVIRTRERELGEGFSNPQIAMGKSIRAKLAAIERRLAHTKTHVSASESTASAD